MINSKFLFIVFIILGQLNLFAEPVQWSADSLALNPAGIDMSITSVAPCDLNLDGITDLIVLEDNKNWQASNIHVFLGKDTDIPPYFVHMPILQDSSGASIKAIGLAITDLDDDGIPNLITRQEQSLYDWEIDSTLALTHNSDTFKDLIIPEAMHFPDNPSFYDIDSDGDLDLLVNSMADFPELNLSFFSNIGNASNPIWEKDSTVVEKAKKDPQGYDHYSPVMMKIDNDSLVDLLLIIIVEGHYSISLYPGYSDSTGFYFDNAKTYPPQFYIHEAINSIYPYDYNNDGVKDLLLIDGKNTCRIYLGTGNAENPFDSKYFILNSFPAADYSRVYPFNTNAQPPSLFYVNSYQGWMFYYNDPVRLTPDTLLDRTYYRFSPSEKDFDFYVEGSGYKDQLMDFDNNGLPEFAYSFYFEQYNFHHLYENTKSDFSGEWIDKNNLWETITEQFSDIIFHDINFIDLDKDGDYDFVFQEKHVVDIDPDYTYAEYESEYNFYENTQDPDTLWQLRPDWKQGLPDTVFDYTTFSDLDEDGDYDLILKDNKADSLYAFENTGTQQSPVWLPWYDAFEGINSFSASLPAFADFNNDGIEDMIWRNSSGMHTIYYKDPTLKINHTQNIPQQFILNRNYPNPFNAQTVISFQLFKNTNVELNIFDITGRKVICLNNSSLNAGYHQFIWNGKTLTGTMASSGIYFYQVKIKSQSDIKTITQKMVMVK